MPGSSTLQVHLGLLDVDRRIDRLAHRRDVEVELIAAPPGLHLRAAGNVVGQLVDVVGDAAPGLVLAELVRQVDFDGLCHRYAMWAAVQRFSSRATRV